MPRERREKRGAPEGAFIPAGLLIGMGIGFLVNNLVAWLFIGLGTGFLLFVLFGMMKKKR